MTPPDGNGGTPPEGMTPPDGNGGTPPQMPGGQGGFPGFGSGDGQQTRESSVIFEMTDRVNGFSGVADASGTQL